MTLSQEVEDLLGERRRDREPWTSGYSVVTALSTSTLAARRAGPIAASTPTTTDSTSTMISAIHGSVNFDEPLAPAGPG